jgi:hypothetical protein
MARIVPGNTTSSSARVRREKLETELSYPSPVNVHINIKFPTNNEGVMLRRMKIYLIVLGTPDL